MIDGLDAFLVRFGVYHWNNFEFENGTVKDKFFLCLACSFVENEFYYVLPTSQGQKYHANQRCNTDTILIQKGESKLFTRDTILDLKNIKLMDRERFLNAVNDHKINYCGQLEHQIQVKITKAIQEAYTIPPRVIKKLLCEK